MNDELLHYVSQQQVCSTLSKPRSNQVTLTNYFSMYEGYAKNRSVIILCIYYLLLFAPINYLPTYLA